MDTTDFGYFYAYAWRILEGQIPYRDFYYIKPALPLYWHAFWMWLTPFEWQILAGKAGFCLSVLAAAWFGSLYFKRLFKLEEHGVSLPLLATIGFVFGIHSFPHMPWHTADGILFASASLYASVCGLPVISGLLAACAFACKQSFALVPIGLAALLWVMRSRKETFYFILTFTVILAGFGLWLKMNGAWDSFKQMTTGQLDIREALDAGIYIYLRQNWILPLLAVAPALAARLCKKHLPAWLEPAYLYLALLSGTYIYLVLTQKEWLGFGLSWPTLFMLLGGIIVFFPAFFLADWSKISATRPALAASIAVCTSLLVSWSVAISGGYKIPALFATPLIFAFFIIHIKFYGNGRKLAWFSLAAGLIMFWVGYQYPYIFPSRPLSRSDLAYHAGEIYPSAKGVMVDKDMFERLRELKELRQKYGQNYKTLPGFSFSYYLNRDYPVLGSDWLIDWEINGDIDGLYKELLDKKITVFMERDQMSATRADAYQRAGYGVPQKVVKHWRKVDETPHFVVFQAP